jgi:GNAT superfamily N-acetyltransferase
MRRSVRHPDRHDGQMDEGDARPGLPVQVMGVQPGTAGFGLVLALAARVLAQDRYLTRHFPDALESHVLGAYYGAQCVGFLRFLIQVLGAGAGRPAVIYNGESLKEGYVEAFGVDPQLRRRGIGTALQQHAAQLCRVAGCYQMRSRSPVTSTQNYALKIAAGYVLHPSHENDSYYFLLRL